MGTGDQEDWAAIRDWLDARGRWFALANGERVPVDAGWGVLRVVEIGEVNLVTGAVGACDPFVGLGDGKTWVRVEPGRYPVKLTEVRLSSADGPSDVEAYLTLIVESAAREVRREALRDNDWGGIGVDAGAVCFVDAEAAWRAAASESWGESVDRWLELLEDPGHVGPGRANVALPGRDDGSNLVMCHSGWGDGIYPVVIGYDDDDQVVAVHIDFGVVGTVSRAGGATGAERKPPTARTRAFAMALMLLPALIHFAISLWQGWSVEVAVFGLLGWVLVGWAFSLWRGWVSW